jgi:very-short-patch-repair endonuclease
MAEGFEVDVLWRRERVVLEFDSYEFHATRAAFERDRRRTTALTRSRYIVLRTTWRELTRESHALVARTSEALALNRAV